MSSHAGTKRAGDPARPFSRSGSSSRVASSAKLTPSTSSLSLLQQNETGQTNGPGDHTDRGNSTGMVTPIYMQRHGRKALLNPRKKRKGDGALKRLAHWFVENQIGLSVNLSALLFLTHMFIPKARSHTRPFFLLSYRNPATGMYANGFNDGFFIFYWLVIFTGLRAGTMEYLLAPLAKSKGLNKKKMVTRFAEQGWMILYYSVMWSIGMYIYCTSSYFLNLHELWTNWPDREMRGVMKAFNLVQLAFWFHQIIVINIEERRNDHWQMLVHHFITVSLIWGSYCYSHTRVGNLILILMDQGDLLLSIAKCLRYLGHTYLCDITFGLFMLSWVVARHALYMMVCYSVWAHLPVVMDFGCYNGDNAHLTGPHPTPTDSLSYLLEPFLHPGNGTVCFNETLKWIFLSALLFLQALLIVWLTMIIRVAVKVVRGNGAEDSRSDDEASDEGENEDEQMGSMEDEKHRARTPLVLPGESDMALGEVSEYPFPATEVAVGGAGKDTPLEEEVGVEGLDLKGWERRQGAKGRRAVVHASASSGVSLPGHSDRKELLGRIGCEKQVE